MLYSLIMSTDPNWLSPPSNEQNDSASEIANHTIEAVPTVAATPLEKPSPKSAWVILALVGGIAGVALSCFALALIPFAVLQPAALRSINSASTAVVSIISISGVGLMGAPLAWHALRRMRRSEIEMWKTDWFWVVVSSIVIALALIAGQVILFLKLFSGVVGVLQYVATMLAALILLSITVGSWGKFSTLRAWGHLASGAWLAVPAAFIIEIVIAVVVAVIVAVTLSAFSPSEFSQLQRLFQLYQRTRNIALFSAWAAKPWVIVLGYLMLSFILPTVEELLKPLGVILMLRRKPTPMESFVGGMLGGLGFAAVETLSNLTAIGDVWLITILARFGTMVMHGLTAGMVGWGWGQWAATRSPWKLIRSFASAILLHGIWNACVVTIVLVSLRFGDNLRALQNIGNSAVFIGLIGLSLLVLIGLSLGGLVVLWVVGVRLRKSEEVNG
ncbi:MAG: PrsW family intramembrane metalloprotease [Chloroflexi bacterium]|nr:PrsW family intramembrane metalloprotease [Chloroflexota bacterium]